jgi:hypothetical protein
VLVLESHEIGDAESVGVDLLEKRADGVPLVPEREIDSVKSDEPENPEGWKAEGEEAEDASGA